MYTGMVFEFSVLANLDNIKPFSCGFYFKRYVAIRLLSANSFSHDFYSKIHLVFMGFL